jgi:hypothetical protein
MALERLSHFKCKADLRVAICAMRGSKLQIYATFKPQLVSQDSEQGW